MWFTFTILVCIERKSHKISTLLFYATYLYGINAPYCVGFAYNEILKHKYYISSPQAVTYAYASHRLFTFIYTYVNVILTHPYTYTHKHPIQAWISNFNEYVSNNSRKWLTLQLITF